MSYRRRASALHAARAAAAATWLTALVVAVLIQSNPIVLGALAAALLLAGHTARVGPELRRTLCFALPLALSICVINALVTRDGYTVIWRFGNLPILGDSYVTLQATVYGAVLGLRAACLVMIAALYSTAVDPDQVLRLFRRVSFRSALSASVATRLVPVLIRDSQRLADAQRCRPGPPPGRLALLRATTSGVFDRALDMAAALEVRGYSMARSASGVSAVQRPWSRHDLAFITSATLVVAVSVLMRASNGTAFTAYPALHMASGPLALAMTAALALVALFPFSQRRGVEL